MANIIALDVIERDTIWVAKMQGWRDVGTYDEVKASADSEECRDFDICAEQPDHLKPFYDLYFAYEREHGWITIPDYYKNVYLVEQNEKIEKRSDEPQKRVWTEAEIKHLVQTNDKVLYGALRKLYACQTDDEQACGDTKYHNGIGFNGVDAGIMSSFAEFLNRAGFLTEKQKVIARKKLVKYNRQLTRLANE